MIEDIVVFDMIIQVLIKSPCLKFRGTPKMKVVLSLACENLLCIYECTCAEGTQVLQIIISCSWLNNPVRTSYMEDLWLKIVEIIVNFTMQKVLFHYLKKANSNYRGKIFQQFKL